MSNYKPEYIEYRLSKAYEALRDARVLSENGSWNACINRLYYTCCYAISALLLKNGIVVKTHAGQITQFNQHFVKTGIISKDFGRLYTNLMDWWQKGDYGDMFDFSGEVVKTIIEPIEHFLDEIARLLSSLSLTRQTNDQFIKYYLFIVHEAPRRTKIT